MPEKRKTQKRNQKSEIKTRDRQNQLFEINIDADFLRNCNK